MKTAATRYGKGLTPVIATVLLMTVAVAASATAYTFMRSSQNQLIEGIQSDLDEQELKSQSQLSIEWAYRTSDDEINVTLRNTGSVPIPLEENNQKLLSLYVDGVPCSSTSCGMVYNDTERLQTSGTLTINTNSSFPADGESKMIKITGPYETSSSYLCASTGSDSC